MGRKRMIYIKAFPDIISIQGHAGAGPSGKDIVCAGVSALQETYVYAIQELTDDQLNSTLSSGLAIMSFPKPITDEAKILTDAFLLGLKAIANTYPDNVMYEDLRDKF